MEFQLKNILGNDVTSIINVYCAPVKHKVHYELMEKTAEIDNFFEYGNSYGFDELPEYKELIEGTFEDIHENDIECSGCDCSMSYNDVAVYTEDFCERYCKDCIDNIDYEYYDDDDYIFC